MFVANLYVTTLSHLSSHSIRVALVQIFEVACLLNQPFNLVLQRIYITSSFIDEAVKAIELTLKAMECLSKGV